MATTEKVAFVSGGNRGIGFETARELGRRGFRVIVGARDAAKGAEAAKKLAAEGFAVESVVYDAARRGSENDVLEAIRSRHGKLDVLVNNAGVLGEPLFGNSVRTVDEATLEDTFSVNLFAVVRLTRALLPLLQKAEAGRVVNVSSILGSLTLHAAPESPIGPIKAFAYNASKAALNAFTIHLAAELAGTKVKVNSVHPGWVKTALGGPEATDDVLGSGAASARLATIGAEGPSGGFFTKDDALPW